MEIKIKRGTSTYLSETNPVLAPGEPCLETDTRRIKYGDGATPWNQLAYANPNVNMDGGELSAPAPGSDPGTFTPPSLEGLALWLDGASRFEGFVSLVGSGVSQWLDKSPEKNNFFQSLKENRPVNSGTVNGLGVVTFDGDNDAMLGSFRLPAECTVFVVFKRNGTSTNGRVFAGTRSDNSEFSFCATEDGASFGVLAGGEYLTAHEVEDQTTAVYSLVLSGSSVTTRINGLSTQTASYANDKRFKSFSVGSSRSNYSSGAYAGDIAEMVVYDHVLTETERQQVESYLLGRWGIVQTTHPLLTGMKAFWPMNEESGTRLDIKSQVLLAETGTVGFVPGVMGNGAELTGGNNHLEAPGTLGVSGSFSVSAWFKPDAVEGGSSQILQNWSGAAGQMKLGFGDSPADADLLLHFDGIDGSTTFTDSSANALAVTANGAAAISTAQSKFGGASGYFDGNADLSFTPTDATRFGTEDFTIEFWLYVTDSPQDNQIIVSFCIWPNVSGCIIHYGNSYIGVTTGGFNDYLYVNRGANNQWHHYAVVRTNGQVAIYVDGVAGTPTSQQGNLAGNFTDGLQYIGRPTDVDFYKLFGYIDELRITNGVAVYTSNFTPPTAPFGGTGSSLFGRIATDAATFGVSLSGVEADLWHHAAMVYSEESNTLTLYHDGEQVDQVAVTGTFPAGSVPFRVGIGDQTSDQNDLAFSADQLGIWDRALTSDDIAMLWNGGFGKEDFTADTFGDNVSLLLHMNKLPNVMEQVAADPYWNDVSLLLHMDGANGSSTFTDSSRLQSDVLAVGGALISTVQSKFGGSSVDVTQSGRKLLVNSADAASLGSGDFTIECWLYWTGQISGFYTWGAIAATATAPNPGGWYFLIDTNTNNGVTNGLLWIDSSSGFVVGTSPVPSNEWCHVAVVRSGTQIKMYINGVEAGGGTSTENIVDNGPVAIGADNGEAGYVLGYIDDFRITKGVARYTANFTPPTAAFPDGPVPPKLEPYSTELLLHFDGNLTDSSPNNLSVTANGATISNAQSKFGGASGYFDGNSYLSLPNENLGLSESSWTVDMWIYPLQNNGYMALASHSLCGSSFFGYEIALDLDGEVPGRVVRVFFGDGPNVGYGPGSSNSRFPIPDSDITNKWIHLAVAREGSSVRCFWDGVQIGTTTTTSVNINPLTGVDAPVTVGARLCGSPGNTTLNGGFDGYIDELRIVKGKAVYADNFTPPTAPLLPIQKQYDTVETSLLLNFNGSNGSTTFTDSSDTPKTIYAESNSVISTTQAKFGQSAYFNGQGYRIYTDSSADFDISGGAYTIEFWLYVESDLGGDGARLVTFEGADGRRSGMLLYKEAGQTLYTLTMNWYGVPVGFGQVPVLPANEWAHVALVYDGTAGKFYVNGVETNSTATHPDWSEQMFPAGSYSVSIGANTSPFSGYNFNGYIDDFRIVKGKALYTSNFTPPTAELTVIEPVQPSLLLHFNGDFADSSNNNLTVTANGNAAISTAQSKFGGASGYFNGANDVAVVNNWDGLGGDDFTIECWIYLTGNKAFTDANANHIIGQHVPFVGADWFIGIIGDTGLFAVYNGSQFLNGLTQPTENVWHHIALVRSGADLKFFLNGTQEITTTAPVTFTNNLPFGIGGTVDPGSWVGCYIDDLRIVKGAALYTANFTPPSRELPDPVPVPAPEVQASLLLHFDGSDGSTTFTDSSANALTVTANGGAVISTAQSKFGGASGYFDGTSTYLEVEETPELVLGLNNEPFTAELFANFADTQTRFFFGSAATVGEWNVVNGLHYLLFTDNGVLYWQFLNSGTAQPGSPSWGTINTALPTTNEWHHLAVCYDGTITRLFVDGVLVGQNTDNYYAPPQTSFVVGTHGASQYRGQYIFNGYIDELRIVKGTAVYTGNFTPPTAPFGGEAPSQPITYFYDSSKHHHTVTAVGDAQIKTDVVKFGNGAGKFDGDGDYLTVPYTDAFDLTAGDWTIECWVKFSSLSGEQALVELYDPQSDTGFVLIKVSDSNQADGDKVFFYSSTDGSLYSSDSNDRLSVDTWYHVAVVRSADATSLFVGGVLQASGDVAIGEIPAGGPLCVGGRIGGINGLNGRMDDLRITKGVARYTSNFTPPTREFPDPIIVTTPSNVDPYAEDVVLLLHCDGANGSTAFTDNSYVQNAVTANGSAVVNTVQSRFGGASAYFDGSGYLTAPANSGLKFRNDDFTVEFWAYVLSKSNCALVSQLAASPQPYCHNWGIFYENGNLLFFYGDGSQCGTGIQLTDAVVLSTWTHIAVVRASGQINIYVNGVSVGGLSFAGDMNSEQPLCVGAMQDGSYAFNGYIDDLRITKGVARYTANFTPPTAAFPNPFTPGIDATLLMHFDGAFDDVGKNGLMFTAAGGASISASQSKFGGLSAYFDGQAGTFLSAPSSSDFAFDGDFTIEAWIYRTGDGTAWGGTAFAQIATGLGGGDATGWSFFISNGNQLNFLGSTGSGWQTIIYGPATIPLNQWHHVAVTRSGSAVKIFLNGTETVTGTSSDSIISGSTLYIGSYPLINGYGQASFDGYIDELRIIKGTAVYTSNFTPSTAPFTSGGFLPTDVAGSDLWLDASDSSTVHELGGSLTSWDDKSAADNDAAQYSTYATPSLVAAATPSGLPAVRFNGDPNALEVPHQFNLKNSSGFVVVKQTSQSNGPGYPRILGFQPASGNDSISNDGMCLVINQESGQAIEIFSGGVNCSENVSLPLGWSLIGYAIDANGTVRLRKNGEEVASFQNADMQVTSGSNLLIGFGGASFSSFESLQGDIASVVHYDHKLGAGAMAAVEKYLTEKHLVSNDPTALLMNFDGGFGDSTGNFTTTASGSATTTSVGGLFGGAGYMNGGEVRTDQNLNIAAGEDFTVEMWLKNANPWIQGNGQQPTPFRIEADNAPNPFSQLTLCLHDNVRGVLVVGFGRYITPGYLGTTLPQNQWSHVALVRHNNVLSVYVDGTLYETGPMTEALSGRVIIGCTLPNYSSTLQYNGYIDELRITKGLARYTSNFTPPDMPFGSSTALLMHFDGLDGSTSFVDSSPNNLSVTANGNAVISTAQSKFGGASGYFDGNGDYLEFPGIGFDASSGDWTIEAWIRPESITSSFPIVTGSNRDFYYAYVYQNGSLLLIVGDGVVNQIIDARTDTPPAQTWWHVALVRSGGSMYAYENGVLVSQTSEACKSSLLTSMEIGSDVGASVFSHGYIDELRITKGFGRYTANFTPPTMPFGVQTSLLLHFDGNFTDSSGGVSLVNNGVSINTSEKKFGSGSGLFSASGPTTLTAPDSPAFGFGTGDFTIEMFVYMTSGGGAGRYSLISVGSYQNGILWRLDPIFNEANLFLNASGAGGGAWNWRGGGTGGTGGTVPYDAWTHLALTRQNGVVRVFVGGTKMFEQDLGVIDFGSSRPLTIGCSSHELTSLDAYNGYIDELRIMKGLAIYTDSFTPPAAPF